MEGYRYIYRKRHNLLQVAQETFPDLTIDDLLTRSSGPTEENTEYTNLRLIQEQNVAEKLDDIFAHLAYTFQALTIIPKESIGRHTTLLTTHSLGDESIDGTVHSPAKHLILNSLKFKSRQVRKKARIHHGPDMDSD